MTTTKAATIGQVIPEQSILDGIAKSIAEPWMHPAPNPYGVVFEGYLSDATCDELIQDGLRDEEPYKQHKCGAHQTRQYDRNRHHAILWPITELAHRTNDEWWKYDVDQMATAWLQTYRPGGDYSIHADSGPGHSRKLTAVAMVSDPADYEGGDLTLKPRPGVVEYAIPRTRGTVAVFLPWILHDVSTITSGVRHTVNLGLWGPPLR